LKTSFIDPLTGDGQALRFGAGYCDTKGASHQRSVVMRATYIQVVDEVAGFVTKGVLRWRLMPGDWRVAVINGRVVCNCSAGHSLAANATMHITRCEIAQGWESRHYLEKTPVPVLEIEFQQPGTLISEYRWAT
jgi:hypothetical protein